MNRWHDAPVERAETADVLTVGERALASGDWEAARNAFRESLEAEGTPEAHDGLGRALWWLGDVDGALHHREAAYAALRREGQAARAARIALWVAREYAEALGNEPAAGGWVARAEGLLRDLEPGPEHGWLELTRGERAPDAPEAERRAEAALEVARRFSDPDLEASALALLGRTLIARGDVGAGMSRLDEAMTAATGGEVMDPLAFGDVCCVVVLACEEAGDMSRVMKWNQVVEAYLERHHHAPLMSFCGTCCAAVFEATGDLKQAEEWLVQALAALEGTGHRARCVHPAAKLAELRVLQGRLEEAERLLAGYEDLPEAFRAAAALHLARGESALASALLHRRLNWIGREGLLALPLLTLLIQAQVAQGDASAAASTADEIGSLAERTGEPKVAAAFGLAAGRAALAAGSPEAGPLLESAVDAFSGLQMPLEAARARLELARASREVRPEVAAREARLAQDAFEAAGASPLADEAAGIVRDLGGPARTGPKLLGLLSRRETEVLRLLSEGLTNAEIATRLFISTKTAGNHVSNVLSKLNLRSRSEAAAYAVRYLHAESAPK